MGNPRWWTREVTSFEVLLNRSKHAHFPRNPEPVLPRQRILDLMHSQILGGQYFPAKRYSLNMDSRLKVVAFIILLWGLLMWVVASGDARATPLRPSALGVPASASASATGVSTPAAWHWPVARVAIIRDYAAPQTRYGAGHRGIDVATHVGERVFAPMSGQITFVGHVVDEDIVTETVAGIWKISVESVVAKVRIGEHVRAGDVMGMTESNSHCSGLHIGVRWHDLYVSPALLFGQIPSAILLPW